MHVRVSHLEVGYFKIIGDDSIVSQSVMISLISPLKIQISWIKSYICAQTSCNSNSSFSTSAINDVDIGDNLLKKNNIYSSFSDLINNQLLHCDSQRKNTNKLTDILLQLIQHSSSDEK